MSNSVRVSFLGDISLNGRYEEMYLRGDKPFNNVNEELKDSIVVGNLECFVRGDSGVNKLKIPRLETGLETLNYLKDFNLQVACLANNHVFDQLEDGFSKTIGFLEKNSINFLGASLNNNDFRKPFIIERNDIKIGLLNYVTKDTNPKPPDSIRINLNWFDINKIIDDIKQIKPKVDHVVLSLHWGGKVEKGYFPDLNQPIVAKRLIDSGADLIIGHHSHTVQPFEIYKGKYIFYSLGNFCFDDIFHENQVYFKLNKRQKKTLAVKVEFKKDYYQLALKPFVIHKLFIINKQRLINSIRLRNYSFIIIKRFPVLWKLYYFQLKKINIIVHYLFVKDGSFLEKLYSIKINKVKKLLLKTLF